MPAQDWTRLVHKGRAKAKADADSIPIEAIIAFYGGEVKEGRNVSVRCCIHEDTRRSAVIDTYNNLYFCHTCGKGGTGVQVVMEKENLGFKDALQRANEIITAGGHTLRKQSGRSNRKVSRRTWDI